MMQHHNPQNLDLEQCGIVICHYLKYVIGIYSKAYCFDRSCRYEDVLNDDSYTVFVTSTV